LKPDAATETHLLQVLERFCSAFTDRDAQAVMCLFDPDPDVVVITSEEPLLRGPVELRRFLDRYVAGHTTYSWEWQRHDISTAGSVAWLLADGTETAATEDGLQRHPYGMTMVLEHHDDRWLLRQVHGSSPH
jgi:ketosteroid isomerase-like protein